MDISHIGRLGEVMNHHEKLKSLTFFASVAGAIAKAGVFLTYIRVIYSKFVSLIFVPFFASEDSVIDFAETLYRSFGNNFSSLT